MCGIVGIYNFKEPIKPHLIQEMTDALKHRGPDDEGYLAIDFDKAIVHPLTGVESQIKQNRIEEFERPANLFLGHRRLSVIDLSPAGHQPMCNEDGSLWIVHNGEVYNYLEIKRDLERHGHHLKSKTDTEVILHSYEEWGRDCLKYFNGMWAFAIVDLKNKRIFCSRDRAGVKPLYYVYDGNRFAFASEIKSLLNIDHFSIEPNEQMIADYLFAGWLDHTRETFFKNIYQLRPGEYLLLEGGQLITQTYWDIQPNGSHISKDSDVERFYELFEDSIRLRLRTDVTIGSCLSGGLDSSSIVCLANRLMFDGSSIDPKLVGARQKTFSSCFGNPFYDERYFIEKVIATTGAEKNYTFPGPEDFFENIYPLIWHQEEPFLSTSMYAQWKVMSLAKQRGVTVLLDGQGGDELLAGYLPSYYFSFKQMLREGHPIKMINALRKFLKTNKKLSANLPQLMMNILLKKANPLSGKKLGEGKIKWANEGFTKKYLRTLPKPKVFEDELNNYLYQLFRITSLPCLLRFEDRNSMAFSLETRLPFLDYRLVEFVFNLPPEQKIAGGTTKAVLRKAMKRILPEEIRERADKMGFVTPEDIWFRTILKEPIYHILNSRSFAIRGYFNVDKVMQAFDNYCKGKMNCSSTIWRWVNLELWLRIFVDKCPQSEVWGRGVRLN